MGRGMSAYPDILASAALPLLVELEADGFSFSHDGDRLLVRPIDRLSPELRERVRRERGALLLLLRICDEGVQARREVFARQLSTMSHAVLPELVFRTSVPYVAGRCFSCGEATEQPTFGRCARCALAWRLAAGVPIPSDFAAVYDAAKRVA
jgi:hypothetical protein